MDKIKIQEALVVEGKYDKNTLAQIIDAPIFVTDGFGIFKDPEKLALLRAVAERRGLIVLTDSDGAGLVIRNHLKGTIDPALVKHAYIPDIFGKERRKAAPGKEGKLGVEGMEPQVLIVALRNAGATVLDTQGSGIKDPGSGREQGEAESLCSGAHRCATEPAPLTEPHLIRHGCAVPPSPQGEGFCSGAHRCATEQDPITKTDLFALGLTGRPDSREKRKALQKRLGLPENLSANALLTALNCIMTREELAGFLASANAL